jgi:hypothetical protein
VWLDLVGFIWIGLVQAKQEIVSLGFWLCLVFVFYLQMDRSLNQAIQPNQKQANQTKIKTKPSHQIIVLVPKPNHRN